MRILFVDDEPNILRGLKNLLYKERRRYEMAFALSGQDALTELEKAPYDVVVSDMRMPGMNGMTLLSRVKEQYPGTARIMLSGQADQESIMHALPIVHQFLSKPCEVEVLRSTIQRVCDLQQRLGNEHIRQVVGQIECLPSVPKTYQELTQIICQPESSLSDIARIVERDPAISARILQLCNSAYFGSTKPLTSIPKAVLFLGVELLKALALTAHVFIAMEEAPPNGFSLEKLQRCSMLSARLARMFSIDAEHAEIAFTTALVHDIGKAVLALGLPRYDEIVGRAREIGQPLFLVEQEQLEVTHAEVGAYLLGLWGLPFPMVESVAYHHQPSMANPSDSELLATVHVAGVLAEASRADRTSSIAAGLDLDFLQRSGFMAELERWQRIAVDEDLEPSPKHSEP